MAIYNASLLISASNATYFTNTTGGIAAVDVRTLNDSWISSSALLTGSNTFVGNQIISGNVDINGTISASLQTGYIFVGDGNGRTQAVATSSIIANTDTGSLLVTASFSEGTRNITFTKGDGSNFNLGGFATTGSNTFTGNQYIYSTSGATPLVISSSAYYGIELQNQGIQIKGNGGPRIQFPNATWMNGNEGDNFQFTGDTDNPLTKGLDFYLYGTGSRAMTFRNNSGPGGNILFTTSQSVMSFNAGDNIGITAGNVLSLTGSQTNINGLRYPQTDGTNGQALITNGSGILSFGSVSINTGSFATTGSNTFNGDQSIRGDIQLLSGSNLGKITFPNNSQLSGIYGDQFKFSTSETSAQFLINSSSLPLNMIFENRGNNGQTQFLNLLGTEFHSASSYTFNGGNATFAGNIYAANLTGSSGVSGSYATLGANLFTGSQTIQSGSQIIFNGLNGSSNDNGLVWGTGTPYAAKLYYSSGSTNNFLQFAGDVGIDFSVGSPAIGGSNINFRTQNTAGQIQFTSDSSSISLKSGTTTTISGSGISLNTNATGNINNRGVVTIAQNVGSSLGESYLLGYSGSLVLGNSTATPTYAALSHISSSQINANTNLIFKTSTATANTIVSGSNNIFTNPTAPTAGFRRYIGGNGNLMLGPGAVNQISASQTFPIATNFNIHGNGLIQTRGPVSASQWTMQNNVLVGSIFVGQNASNTAQNLLGTFSANGNVLVNSLSIVANRTAISASTSVANNAIIGGATTLNLASSSIGYGLNVGSANIVNGFQNGNAGVTTGNDGMIVQQNWFGAAIINVSGSDAGGPTNPRFIGNNYLFGGYNTSYTSAIANLSLNGSGSSMLSTIAMGHDLGITGSNGLDTNTNLLVSGIGAGSAFFGRWNSQSGNRARTAETVFAVGTGTSTSATKTGFLIDSGSNTFIEGTLNVSGSTTITGSLTISSSATYDLTVIDSMQVSSSAGRVTIGTNGFVTTTPSTNVGSYVNVFSIAQSNTTTGDEFGFTLDTDAYGVSGWSGPAIYGNDTSDLYPAFLGFQNKSTYTDGRVTALTPLVTSGSLIANSYTILTSVSASLNFADDTAAAAGGVPLGGLYRNGNFVMIRLT